MYDNASGNTDDVTANTSVTRWLRTGLRSAISRPFLSDSEPFPPTRSVLKGTTRPIEQGAGV